MKRRNKPNTITIPKGWNQITIGQYEEILDSLKLVSTNHILAWCNAIAAATHHQPGDISSQPLYIINQQIEALSWLTEAENLQFVNEFNLCGNTYVVNPDIKLMSPDRFIYLQRVLAETGPRQKARLVALFTWRRGEIFQAKKYDEIAETIYNHCPCNILLPLSVFFCKLGKACAPHIQNYLGQKSLKQMREVQQEMAETLKEQGIVV